MNRDSLEYGTMMLEADRACERRWRESTGWRLGQTVLVIMPTGLTWPGTIVATPAGRLTVRYTRVGDGGVGSSSGGTVTVPDSRVIDYPHWTAPGA